MTERRLQQLTIKIKQGGKIVKGYQPVPATGKFAWLEHAGGSLRKKEIAVPLEPYLRECVNVPKYLAFCKECPNYNTRWSCPPYDDDPEDVWRRFTTLRLVSYILLPEPGQSVPDVLKTLTRVKETMLWGLLALEREIPGSLALSAGSCTLCAECTRPGGTPCRDPARMRRSIESLGGDVALTAERYLDVPLLWIRDGVLPEYLTLVGGLLVRDA